MVEAEPVAGAHVRERLDGTVQRVVGQAVVSLQPRVEHEQLCRREHRADDLSPGVHVQVVVHRIRATFRSDGPSRQTEEWNTSAFEATSASATRAVLRRPQSRSADVASGRLPTVTRSYSCPPCPSNSVIAMKELE